MPDPVTLMTQRAKRAQDSQPGIKRPMKHLPDALLIATLVNNGQPQWAAAELKTNPQLRLAAARFFFDVEDAGQGDKVARQRVDYMRESWVRLRKEELIADDPKRMHHHLIDPKDLL